MRLTNLAASEAKVVLCAPRWCGLNDTLVQIWLSYGCALEQGRVLVIDTRVSGFWDNLGEYFTLTPTAVQGPVPIQMQVTDSDIARFNGMSAYPTRYQGRVDFIHREILLRLLVAHNRLRFVRSMAFVARALNSRIAPPFQDGIIRRLRFLTFVASARLRRRNGGGRDPRGWDLVVHHQSGGGPESIKALEIFALTPPLRQAVQEALETCGDDFDALHIRNTDIQSDFERLFSEARIRLSGRRVLVCSDDATVINLARQRLPESDVFTVTQTEATSGAPLHKEGGTRSPRQRRSLNFNMIVDLICLARSRELLVAEPIGDQRSGFSSLALSLHNRSDIVDRLVGM